MSTEPLIPNRFLFDFEIPLLYREAPPKIDGKLDDWSDAQRLPALGEIDGQDPFGEVYACWNEDGLYIACRVSGKRQPPVCDPRSFWTGDNLRLLTDMRDARSLRRATRTCQQFFFLPTGGGQQGKDPVAGSAKVQRARDDAPLVAVGGIPIASRVTKSGYTLEAHLPAEHLAGFDPSQHPRIGLYYMLEDAELGQQYLTVGDELMWNVDPSTWATAVLAGVSS